MTQEALKLALDALETELSIDWTNNDEFNASAEKIYKAIAAIKEALLQPEQEPVAWEQFYPDIGKPQIEMRVEGPRHVICQCDKCKAQPEQEPVGYWKEHAQGMQRDYDLLLADYEKLAQLTWVGLEGEEIRNLWEEATKPDRSTMTMVTSFARTIEAKLKEKNT
jgi:hypothetical protein